MPLTSSTASTAISEALDRPTSQDIKRQASRIYEALDARGYGIVKRQAVAEALPNNKVNCRYLMYIVLPRTQHNGPTCSIWHLGSMLPS